MGAYLSEPVTEKISSDDDSEHVRYGASSMQGWRVSQEDAHNCIINFDKNTSLFAVYDGHGGHEVAQYCSQKLPDFIKETDAYKRGDFNAALIDAFLGFDATIAAREVVAFLKEIAGIKDANTSATSDPNSNPDSNTSNSDSTAVNSESKTAGLATCDVAKSGSSGGNDSDSEAEDVSNLYEEAVMPIEQVMEKYQAGLIGPGLKKLQDGYPVSPMLKARKSADGGESSGASCSKISNGDAVTSGDLPDVKPPLEGQTAAADAIKDTKPVEQVDEKVVKVKEVSFVPAGDGVKAANVNSEEDLKSGANKEEGNRSGASSDDNREEGLKSGANSEEEAPAGGVKAKASGLAGTEPKGDVANGEAGQARTSRHENGEVGACKGKGKALMKKKAGNNVEQSAPAKNLRTRDARQLYNRLLDLEDEEEEDSDSEDDNVTFDSSSGEESSGADCDDDDDDDDDEDDEDDEEDDLYEDEDDEDSEFTRNMPEEPGSDSGCTAVVALLRGRELFVANAGDSRCIVCRNGQAVEMSLDHKPEDEPEMARVLRAGGRVTQDGRVNGGLNLSRAIGDHAYKQNPDLSSREQMITALPDIRTLSIDTKQDEFMVLACDGIWNFMSSQEVVDFIRPRLQSTPDKLSRICEEMFDHCLAPNTMGDGTGCDNMTAIIVQFKTANVDRKRAADEETPLASKRPKTDALIAD